VRNTGVFSFMLFGNAPLSVTYQVRIVSTSNASNVATSASFTVSAVASCSACGCTWASDPRSRPQDGKSCVMFCPQSTGFTGCGTPSNPVPGVTYCNPPCDDGCILFCFQKKKKEKKKQEERKKKKRRRNKKKKK
jgi:hypothetical protein